MTDISTVLFDADGVVQTVPDNWIERWGDFLDSPCDTKAFLDDIFAAEAPHAFGKPGFATSIENVLKKWGLHHKFDAVLKMWEQIELNDEVLSLIQRIRSDGVFVGLATNQHNYRLKYMRDTMNYHQYFDSLYVSCEIGHTKPSQEYFSYIINTLRCEPSKVLFVDDSEENVVGAESIGINAVKYHMKEGKGRLSNLLISYGIKCP